MVMRTRGPSETNTSRCELKGTMSQVPQSSMCEKRTMVQVPQRSRCGSKGTRRSGDVQYTRMTCFLSKISSKMIHYRWDPYPHVFINLGTEKSKIFRKNPKYRWHMTLLQFFSKWVHIAIGFCKRCSELSKLFRIVQKLFTIVQN